MLDIKKVRNIGIAAHIDSGKTTVSERILFFTGKIHKIVEVRSKTGDGPTMDSMDLEREKGITIQSAATSSEWKGHFINLIDTPGHIDFTVEVERALRVLDGAVLVLCGVAGVQSQSITVDRQMRRYKVPRISFINKLDRSGANHDRVIKQLNEKLNQRTVLMNFPMGLEDKFNGIIDLLTMEAVYFEGPQGEEIVRKPIPAEYLEEANKRRHDMIEAAADFDDDIMEKFLGDEPVENDAIKAAIRKATIALHITPVFCGTAKMNKGVQTMLDGVIDYLPNPSEIHNEGLDLDKDEARITLETDSTKPTIALAFKLEDGKYGQLTYMRVYQGKLTKGENIINTTNGKKYKIPRLVKMHASEMVDVEEAEAGDIIATFGIDCASGDTFTDGKVNVAMTSMYIPTPVIELAVKPKEKSALENFSKALNRFQKEDPTFRVSRDEESGETLIKGMGELHLEIYIERIKREYNCEVLVGQPKVAYRETITQKSDYDYTHKKQSGGSGQFARIAGYIEPIESEVHVNYEFENKIVGGVVPKEYIPAVDKGFQEQLHDGVLIKQPVVGVRCILNDGSTHSVDSSDMAFKIAAKAAIRETMMKCNPIILEPIMKLEVSAPEEFQGVVIGQLNQRRGIIVNTNVDETGYVVVEAEMPLKEMFGYSTDIRSATQGKGEFTMEFLKYAPVPRSVQEEIIKDFKAKEAEANK